MSTENVPLLHDRRVVASAAPDRIGSSNEFRLPTLRNRDSLPAAMPSGDLNTHLKDGYK